MAGVVVHVLYDIFGGTDFYKNRKAAAVLLTVTGMSQTSE